LITDHLQAAVELCINDGKKLPEGLSPIELELWKRKNRYLTTYADWGNNKNKSTQNVILAGNFVIDVAGQTVENSTSPLVKIYRVGDP